MFCFCGEQAGDYACGGGSGGGGGGGAASNAKARAEVWVSSPALIQSPPVYLYLDPKVIPPPPPPPRLGGVTPR